MPISAANKVMLTSWAAHGDIYAQEALAQEATGRAGLVSGGTPATASATAVHASVRGDVATNPILTPVNPDVPRNVTATFGAAWDGGDIVVTGTDQFGQAGVTETLVSNPGTIRTGTKIFKTITSLAKTAIGVAAGGTNTVTIGTGTKLGILVNPLAGSPVILYVDGVAEAVTMDTATHAFTPTTAPNAAHVYVLMMNI